MIGKSLSDNQGKLIPWVLLTLGQRVIICTAKSIQLDIVILITVISKVLIFGLTVGILHATWNVCRECCPSKSNNFVLCQEFCIISY